MKIINEIAFIFPRSDNNYTTEIRFIQNHNNDEFWEVWRTKHDDSDDELLETITISKPDEINSKLARYYYNQ